MRVLLLCTLLVAGMGLALGTTPDTPADGAPAQEMCQLKSLTFSGGLFLTETFDPSKYDYTCSCATGAPLTAIAFPITQDPGSTAEVTFNGAQVNFRTNNPPNGISNFGSNPPLAPNSPATQSVPLVFQPGFNIIIIGVGCNGHATPECYYQYTISCTLPESGGSVVGDPQFVGLRGQQYQIHGVSGEVYNIVSDADLQYNSRFVFLSQGECPVVNGRKQKGCFSHPGSYLGELGLKTRAGDKIRLLSGPAKRGFAGIEVNGKSLDIGETVMLAGDLGSISMNTTHQASVQVGKWDFVFENSDMYLNQQVRVADKRHLRSHGLLGQTWREATYPNAIKYIQGEVDDYVIRDSDIFGDNFVYNNHN